MFIPLSSVVLSVFVLTAVAWAALGNNPIRLVVNGQEIKPEVPPQIIHERVLVPARWVAEAMGAGVEWEEATRTVKIEAPPVDSLRRRLVLLEKALKPASPEEAVRNWATAVQTRNGAWQYALLAPDLQERYRPDYERTGWVTGTSSPWVDKYTILEQKEDKEGNWLFTVQFDLLTSTGPAGSYVHHITVQPRDGGWYIAAIDSTEDEWGLKVQLQKQVEDLVARQYRHYRVLDTRIDLQSFKRSGSQAEAVYLVQVSHLLGVASPERWPPQKGRIEYLEENRDRLAPEALAAIEKQIAFWQQELQEYITKPQEANQFLKVTARFDSQGRLQKDSVQFFVEDPVGQYIPLDMNQPYFQSEAELIRQGYEEMRQLAEAVQAPAGKLLIKESTPVYAAPSPDSQKIRRVEAGAVAALLEETTGWFKVKVNVYDTPGNDEGWVPAACGEKLTKENYLQAREVFIKKDAPVYECSEYASIKQVRPTRLPVYDRVYRLVREEQDMVFFNGPGGASYWTAKENIVHIQP
ncbi:stalk domain-containing protein [Desulfofundulus thermocisternus]|uniref:stalk domain-containing protein n=1 Tax=Desulfofundulus thermocisternus TaxID=42471 RepID=UPI00217CEADA|nr:stalk domain-containing protein [Desulfofundulus thermocisternus]MCS5695646.1 stalk domain-containing protein [Desulfofundulus thermocisternus]